MSKLNSKITAVEIFRELCRRQAATDRARGGLKEASESSKNLILSGQRSLQWMKERLQKLPDLASTKAQQEMGAFSNQELLQELQRLEPKTVNGTDDRRDMHVVRQQLTDALAAQVMDPREHHYLESARAVGCIMVDQYVIEAAQGYLLQPNITIGEQYNLCPNERFRNQPQLGTGTAFLIAQDVMMTAYHVLNSSSFLDGTRVVFDYSLDQAPPANGYPKPWLIPANTVFEIDRVLNEDTTADWCVFKLKKAPQRPALRLSASAPQITQPLYMLGYPDGTPLKLADNARVKAIEGDHFICDLDSFHGNSGSPVFNSSTHEVVGMLQKGGADYQLISNGSCSRVVKDPSGGQEKALILNSGLNIV